MKPASDLSIAIGLAPPAARDFLSALFALTDELTQIPAKVTQPTLGLVRIVWWRDAILGIGQNGMKLGELKAHPTLQALAAFPDKAERLAAYAETFGDAFDGDDQHLMRAELLASLCGDVLPAPLPLLYQAALALENPDALPELRARMKGVSRRGRRAAAALLFLAFAPAQKTPLGRAWLAIRLAFGF